MPFFQISDDGSFSKVFQKIWIYFIVAGILTMLTFASSSAWDSVQWIKNSFTVESTAKPLTHQAHSSHDEATNMSNPDKNILEPIAIPEPELQATIQSHVDALCALTDQKKFLSTSSGIEINLDGPGTLYGLRLHNRKIHPDRFVEGKVNYTPTLSGEL
jgi:hypothetical protein